MRSLIIALALVAGVLFCAIFVAANSPGHSRSEAALADAKAQAEDACREAALRTEDNADLRKRLDAAKAELEARAEKVAAAEKETSRLRGDLDAALRQIAELNKKYAEQIKKV